MDSLTFHRSTKSMLSTRLRSGSRFSPSINWTQPGTHPHLDAASAPYHLHQSPSQAIGSMTSISNLQQLHALRQYQACLRSPLRERKRDNEHHRVHILPYHQSRTPPRLIQVHSTTASPSAASTITQSPPTTESPKPLTI